MTFVDTIKLSPSSSIFQVSKIFKDKLYILKEFKNNGGKNVQRRMNLFQEFNKIFVSTINIFYKTKHLNCSCNFNMKKMILTYSEEFHNKIMMEI